MKKNCFGAVAAALAWLLAAVPAAAEEDRGYYGHPAIHGETIVFHAEGSLWRVDAAGGRAERLTGGRGLELHPRFSPDGEWIAFAGQYEGSMDVYVMPAEGGTPRRLTHHGYAELPTAWAPDGSAVYFHSAREHPFFVRTTFRVPFDGGMAEQLPIGPASYLVMAEDGKTVAFNRNYVQPRTWDRYGGGLADNIWMGDLEAGEFRQVTTYFGNDLTPMFAAGRLFFKSERDGWMNLWSVSLDGDDLRQHTAFDDFAIRRPSTDGERIVFQKGADIWLYDPEAEEATLVDIRFSSDRPERRRRLAEPRDFLESYAVTNDGRRTVLSIRGDLFNIPVEAGRPVPITETPGVRETEVAFAGEDSEYILYLSDESGEYELFRTDARTGTETVRLAPANGEVEGFQPFFNLEVDPEGRRVAWADHTGRLYYTDIEEPDPKLVVHARVAELRGYDWSPDGHYLAYSLHGPNRYRRIYIHDTGSGESFPVTDAFHDSFSPAWDPEGDYLFYLSARTFNRQGGAFEYENVMVEPTKAYAVLLREDVENPFFRLDPYEEDEEEEKEKEEENNDNGKDEEPEETKQEIEQQYEPDGVDPLAEEEEDKPEPLQIDRDGILDRQVEFPMPSGNLGNLRAAKDKVFYMRWDGNAGLMSFSYKEDDPEPKEFASGIDGYTLSADRSQVAYRRGSTVRIAGAGAARATPDDKGPDLGRIRLLVEPEEEWRQIHREAFRFYRDYFYAENMGEMDWEAVAERYASLLPRIGTRRELTDLLGGMISELGHSHTYIFGDGDAAGPPHIGAGMPAMDFEHDEESGLLRVTRIYRGEPWNPHLQSPWNTRRNREVEEGWFLLAVNGGKVSAEEDINRHFWGYANEEVQLTLAPEPDRDAGRDYRVRLLGEDWALRRHDWEEANRRYVSEQSDGRIGYVHLPNMGTEGLVAFYRQYYPQLDREALVIDVRYNGGGNVSQLLIRRLREELYALRTQRQFDEVGTYPFRVFVGPMACVMNQNTASDGDIFAHSFRLFELGPLIGTRTWGGTVGIRSHTRFVDGGGLRVPEFPFIDLELGYDIENYGIDPDDGFEVDITPEDFAAGRDPQLDLAIEYLLAELETGRYEMPELPEELPDRSVRHFRERSEEWLDRP